jgi:hypothetical protein
MIMGVLACDRSGCENIMCDKYSIDLGYICWECYNELVSSGGNPKEFMDSTKEYNAPYDYEKIFIDR